MRDRVIVCSTAPTPFLLIAIFCQSFSPYYHVQLFILSLLLFYTLYAQELVVAYICISIYIYSPCGFATPFWRCSCFTLRFITPHFILEVVGINIKQPPFYIKLIRQLHNMKKTSFIYLKCFKIIFFIQKRVCQLR